MTARPALHDDDSAHRAQLAAALGPLRVFASALIRGRPAIVDIDDLLQDVMERALRYAHTFDTQQDVLPWLKRITFRRYLDHVARSQREAIVAGDLHDAHTLPSTPRLDQRDEIERRLAELAPIERRILVSFHRDDLSIAEIAQNEAIPTGTVKSHLHRARRRLAEARSPGRES